MELIEQFSSDFGLVYGKSNKDTLDRFPLQLAYLTCFFVEGGEAIIAIDFKDYTLSKGNFVVVGEDNIVSFKQVSEDFSMHCYLVHRDMASEIAYVLPNKLFSYLHYFPIQYFDVDNSITFNHWQVLMRCIVDSTTIHTKRLMCNQFQSLFLMLSEKVNYEEYYIEKRYSRQEELCWKFWDLISKYAKQHRDVAFYANELFVTPYYLSQVSQQFLDYSPKELINRQVVLEIKHYLVNTDLTISQIADILSFADPSYMGRFFKREVGINPIEYRKR
ncbi:MAG: helix-turn-helix domain-containing protein [Flavobacteriaceae bacterium]|jgi:YesN/AraC family two-component response regulator|nr:helix-turn-helix domain-containing protein [Flavobacteriaceae bacterium]